MKSRSPFGRGLVLKHVWRWPLLIGIAVLAETAPAAQWEAPPQCLRPTDDRPVDVLNHLGARLPANYRLRRLPPFKGHETFEAVLNIKFIKMDYTLTPTGYAGYAPVPAGDEAIYRAQVQQCWNQASKFMIGPGGERLSLRLADPSTDEASLPENKVAVNAGGPEGVDSGTWLPSLNGCGSSIHESMHLLGLDDEYTNGCRAEGPADSVMVDSRSPSSKIGKAALQSGGHIEITCNCLPWNLVGATEIQCKRIVAAMTSHGDHCPKGTAESRSPRYSELLLAGDPMKKQELEAKLIEYGNGRQMGNAENPAYGWIQNVPPEEPTVSILYPAQFRAITRPNCEAENYTYYSCIANDHRAYGVACITLPPVCRSPLDWMK